MKKITIVVVVVILVIIAIFCYWRNQNQEYEAIDEFVDWSTYINERYSFELKFPSSWNGYYVNEDEYPAYSFVGFSFRGEGRQPFTIFQIVRYDKKQWEAIGRVPSLKMLDQSDNSVLVCDGCCYENGDFTGGGQFDEFQIERCKEVPKIIETFKKREQPFQQSSKGFFFGTLSLTGYLDVKTKVCPPEGMCEKTVEYASLVITETDNDLIYDFIGRNQGNSFIAPNAVGLGCYDDTEKRIYSSNVGDDGWVENIISGVSLEKLLSSNPDNLVRIQITKPFFSSGSGAPDCYSHFRNIKVF